MIDIAGLTKVYKMGRDNRVHALRGLDLSINNGEFVSIMGPSGSGKSTLMNVIGCLDRPTSGTYRLAGEEVSKKTDNQLAVIRNRHIGFIFQTFNLLPKLTALGNVELPLVYRGVSAALRRRVAEESLARVGLQDRIRHRPSELSGGQQQRVAIARAIAGKPSIILADEPTGNLDSRSGEEIMQIFQELNDEGITVVLVTHDDNISLHSRRVVRLRDGVVVSDQPVTQRIIARDELAKMPELEVAAL